MYGIGAVTHDHNSDCFGHVSKLLDPRLCVSNHSDAEVEAIYQAIQSCVDWKLNMVHIYMNQKDVVEVLKRKRTIPMSLNSKYN